MTTVGRAIRRVADTVVRFSRPVAPWLGRVAVAFAGALLGLLLGGRVIHDVGPFQSQIAIVPVGTGGALIRVPPLGTLGAHLFDGPLRLQIELRQLRQAQAQQLLHDPAQLAHIGDRAAADVRDALVWLIAQAVLASLVGAVLLSIAVYRKAREPAISAALVLAMFLGIAGVGAATWNPDAVREPKYTGLLANAPILVGNARSIVDRFDVYRKQLADLITNTSKLYSAVATLPNYKPDDSTIRVLHVSDLHLNPSAFNVISSVRRQFKPDFIVDTGDLTDWGSEPESSYVRQIGQLRVPYVFIRGNHDSRQTARSVAKQKNAIVLNGTRPVDVDGLRIIGTGDPRFTPDKDTGDDAATAAKVKSAGERLAKLVDTMGTPPDITMVHDPLSAAPLEDKVPLVLAGHKHKRSVEMLDKTRVLVEGSTGGAGLRGVQGEKPTPLECSVLYFDKGTHKFEAYDDITLGGLGETEATIERHVVGDNG